MPRGGKREKAGRKTTWESGVKFEETSPIRVPNYIKNKVLEIAHRLDAGEDIDLVSNSNKEYLQELQTNLALADIEKQKLSEQLEKYRSDLETESKSLQLKIQELEQENYRLQSVLDKNQLIPDTNLTSFVDLIIEVVETLQDQIHNLRPSGIARNTYPTLSRLQKLVADKKVFIDIDTNSKNNLNDAALEIVTKSIEHNQLDLLDIGSVDNVDNLKPLTAVQLSKRLNKHESFVRKKKYELKNKLDELILVFKQSDPEGVGWQYSESDKKYHPILENQDLRTGSD